MKKWHSSFFVLLFVVFTAWASQCTQYQVPANAATWHTAAYNPTWHQSKDDACQEAANQVSAYYGASNIYYGGDCGHTNSSLMYWYHGTNAASNWQQGTNGQWESASIVSRTGDYCTSCTPGVQNTFNVTTGWGWVTGYNSAGEALMKLQPPDTGLPANICDGQCAYQSTPNIVNVWVDKDPTSQGLSRESADAVYSQTGATCSARSTELDATQPGKCMGSLGTVNGKVVCLATGSDPSTSIPAGTKVTSSTGPTGTTVNPDGSLEGPAPTPTPSTGSTPPTSPGGTNPGGVTNSIPGATTTTTQITFGTVTSGSMPGVPVLYERKYSGSVSDYFGTQIKQMMNTNGASSLPVFSAFFPGWTDNASACPQFSMTVDVGIANFGTFTPDIPCWVWSGVRAILIVSALFLARALIFGG